MRLTTKRLVIIVTLLVFHVGHVLASCKPNSVDVYIIAGQSNAVGSAMVSDLPQQYLPILTVHPNKLVWNYRDNLIEPLILGSNNLLLQDWTGSFGPEGMLTHKLVETNNTPFILFKYAVSGTSLEDDWNSRKNGSLYYSFIAAAAKLKEELRKQGKSPCYKALFWMQGESDSSGQKLRRYKNNFENLKSDIRRSLDASTLPYILGRINPENRVPDFDKVQDEIASNDPLIKIVATSDLPKGSDNLHFNALGQVNLGLRFFESYSNTDWDNITPNQETYLDAYPVPFSYKKHNKLSAVIRSSVTCNNSSLYLVNVAGQRVKTYFEHKAVYASEDKEDIDFYDNEIGTFASGMYILYMDMRECDIKSGKNQFLVSRKVMFLN